jgi:hypothetical protein
MRLYDPGAVFVLLAFGSIVAASRMLHRRQLVRKRGKQSKAFGKRADVVDERIGVIGAQVHAESVAELAHLVRRWQLEGHDRLRSMTRQKMRGADSTAARRNLRMSASEPYQYSCGTRNARRRAASGAAKPQLSDLNGGFSVATSGSHKARDTTASAPLQWSVRKFAVNSGHARNFWPDASPQRSSQAPNPMARFLLKLTSWLCCRRHQPHVTCASMCDCTCLGQSQERP